MTYYHASPAGGLQVLELRKSPYFDKPTQVCLTSLRAMALFYLIRNYEYAYGYTRQGKLYFDEPFPDALKKLYAGKSGWLYTCEEGNYEKTEIPNEFVSSQPVRVLDAEYIPDAYEAILQAEQEGLLSIVRYEEMSDKAREWNEKDIRKEYENASEHPEYRHFLKGNFPEILNA